MTDEKIKVVVEELAKSGGLSSYPVRRQQPFIRLGMDHYLEQAPAVIATLDRSRTCGDPSPSPDFRRDGPPETSNRGSVSEVRPGAAIIYRPPGDQRAYPCRIVAIQGIAPTWLPFSGRASDGFH